jgi:SAM-dependent methyltransferase
MTDDLPWTGERFVPQVSGDVAYEHLHRYALAAELAAGKAVLDIASGEGYGSNMLAKTARLVVGVDVDETVVAHARAAYPAENLTFHLGSCTDIPLPAGEIDLVVSFETIEHHDRHREMMAEIRRVLRPDGVLVVSTPDRRTYSDLTGYANPFHVKELYPAEFEELLRSYFQRVAVYGQRMCCGSAIAPMGEAGPHPFRSYRGVVGDIDAGPGLRDARYLIGLATNGESLPTLPAGLFESADIPTEAQMRESDLAREVERRGRDLSNLQASADLLARLVARIEAPPQETAEARLRELQDEVWYARTITGIRSAVASAVPPSATVAVVSRGDDRLLDLGGRRAVHFPSAEDGGYLGHHPDDDADAIARLEAVRARGADFLLVPDHDHWLLDDYPEFGRYVRERYREIETGPDSCAIIALR